MAKKSTSTPDHIALVLQGGGALGAYQAGVYQGMDEAGVVPNWLAGISIGAFNAALIAGNPKGQRTAALRAFWDTVAQPNGPWPSGLGMPTQLRGLHGPARALLDTWEAWRALTEGQRGFFHPRTAWTTIESGASLLAGGPTTASWYDTRPMLSTLDRLVDFDRINHGETRLSVGAVNVATGNLEYFDNTRMRLDARHILASGALPPAFPAVEIDGQFYWDGGLVSNTPLSRVLGDTERGDSLIFQVDLWPAHGHPPQDLLEVAERINDIRYSSRTRLISDMQRRDQHYRRLLRELLQEIPPAKRKANPWVRHAAELACHDRVSLIHLIYRERACVGHFKDYQFGALTLDEHWQCGQADIARALAHPEWLQLPVGEDSFVVHDATAVTATT
ncbi:MAG TPA: patatin-like phospholipase family protein [Chiayiivirga sp.]|nr:patatin-like phospholipase family protein [Chiayiivirga sp.]